MCMVTPKPCLFNKSCALKGVNRARFMEDRLALVFLENQDLNFAMKQDFYFYVLSQNVHQSFFFLFTWCFH